MISVSGVRGEIGSSMTPEVAARFAMAYGSEIKGGTVVVGTDTRQSRIMMKQAIISGLTATGCKVIDIGVVATPTVLLMVEEWGLAGGIAITASHNPAQWNALKFASPEGLFLDKKQAQRVINRYEKGAFELAEWNELQYPEEKSNAIELHIKKVLKSVNTRKIRAKKFKVAVDCVNAAGSQLVPEALEALGCKVYKINTKPDGGFPHDPEPLPKNLKQLRKFMAGKKVDIGFAVDSDVDRLAILDETGLPIGEDKTLALAADYILSKTPGTLVTNLSSSLAIQRVAERHGCKVRYTPVGEVNVSSTMKKIGSPVGGEGNGGVILPKVHYTRDSTAGMALILEYLADSGEKISTLAGRIPRYFIEKDKLECPNRETINNVLAGVKKEFACEKISTLDGVKILWDDSWLHVRASGTEPIIRVYAEAASKKEAGKLVSNGMSLVKKIAKK